MKRVLVFAVLLVACTVFAAEVGAGAQTAAGMRFVRLKFRTTGLYATLAGTDAAAQKFGGTIGYIDSMKASGIAKFDTTAGIPLAGLTLPPAASSLDSLTALRLYIYDAGDLETVTLGKTSATAESIYIKTQVSANGIGWHDLAVISGQAPVLNAFTVQVTVNAAVITFTSSTNTGQSDKLWTLPYMTKPNAASLRPAQDINHAHEFPWIRWIIMGTRATTNHNLAASVGFLSSIDQN